MLSSTSKRLNSLRIIKSSLNLTKSTTLIGTKRINVNNNSTFNNNTLINSFNLSS